jgi:transposase
MHLSDHDLRQLDDARLERLSEAQARALLGKAVADLKAARERLGQNPSNSSRPPSSRAPWESSSDEDTSADEDVPAATGEAAADAQDGADDDATDDGPSPETAPKQQRKHTHDSEERKRPGRRKGAPGHGRTQRLPVDLEHVHAPACCAVCGQALDASHDARAHNARYQLDLVQPAAGGTGLVLQQTKHTYLERHCACGHWTRAEPGRCGEEAGWTVQLTEWHLAGPTLVVFIVALTQRMRLSRARVQEFLHDWLGLELSTSTINQCIHEAGRAVEPVVDAEVVQTLRNIDLVFADETSWKQDGQLLWLWVFTCATATLFIVGRRTRAIVREVLGETFRNWLMSDGYHVYRDFDQRLRCLAHLIRKAHGLEDGYDREGQRFGSHILQVMETVIDAVYSARGGAPPAQGLRQQHAPMLNALLAACLEQANCAHPPVRALARELLNDWNTFWVVLDHPELPLTNNEAERALRHWVIARRIGMGTRTDQGSRVFALLASVIETCRKRKVSPWPYLAEVLRLRRKDLPAPPLPLPAT